MPETEACRVTLRTPSHVYRSKPVAADNTHVYVHCPQSATVVRAQRQTGTRQNRV